LGSGESDQSDRRREGKKKKEGLAARGGGYVPEMYQIERDVA